MQLQEMQNPLGVNNHSPLQLWQPNRQVATLSNNSNSSDSSFNVTVAEQGQSSSLNDQHFSGQQQLAVDGLASPSSAENSNVVTIEAELQELLYSATTTDSVVTTQQGDVDWWSYDQAKSPANCWDFTPETSSVYQDYTSVVYDM
jgi:myb proto-oncogene protein